MKNILASLLAKPSKIVGMFVFMLTLLFTKTSFAQEAAKATITFLDLQMLLIVGASCFVGVLIVMAALTVYSSSKSVFLGKSR